MAGEVFLHRFPLCILRIYLVPAVWQESSRSVSLIQMYPVSERCRTVVCALDAFFISHPSVQIISYNFYFFLIRNFAFGHKFLPLWKQCFISLSLIEGAYQAGLLSPVYEFTDRGGCWFCPNAKLSELRHLYDHHPDLWQKMMRLQIVPGKVTEKFNRSQTFADIDAMFREWDLQAAA